MTDLSSHDAMTQSAELILHWSQEVNNAELSEEDRCTSADLLDFEIESLQRAINEWSLYWVLPILKTVEEQWIAQHQCPVPSGGFGDILTYETEFGDFRPLRHTLSWRYTEAVAELSPRVGQEIRSLALDIKRSGCSLWSLNNLVEALIGRPLVTSPRVEDESASAEASSVDWQKEGF